MKTFILICCLLFCILPASAQSANLFAEEKIVEIRFRGNFTIPDQTLIQWGGIAVGVPAAGLNLEDLKQKYLETGRFEWVEVVKRYRTFTKNDEVVLLISVKEKEPLKNKFMFFPILTGSDEYGLSYGVQVSAVDLLGAKERLSIPLTWGGTRRAALEGAFELHNPVFQRLTFGVGVSRKENPFYKTGDFRKEAQGVLQRRLKRFELNLQSGWTNIEFGSQRADSANLGTSLAFDTRQDVNLPRNAVYAKIAWNRLSILGGGPGFNFYSLDLRGYKGIWGQAIVAGQFAYCRTDGRLPDWERPFLGGASTLRGYEPGAFSGDNIATTSLELRMTLSPLRAIYRSGVDVFLDSGAIYDYGQSLGSAKWKHGAGVGGYFLIAGFGIKVDVGYNMHDAFRVHFSTGFRF